MKTKLINNAPKLLLVTLVAGLLAGCAATRPISDVALGAGGAYLGHELSDGDPLATAAGAAGGVILSEGLHFAAKKQSDKAYAAGYDKGACSCRQMDSTNARKTAFCRRCSRPYVAYLFYLA